MSNRGRNTTTPPKPQPQPLAPEALQATWDEAHQHGSEARQIAGRIEQVDAEITRRREALTRAEQELARAQQEQTWLRGEYTRLSDRANAGRAMVEHWCITYGVALPQDPAAQPATPSADQPADAAVCRHPHCGTALAKTDRGWLHLVTGQAECTPGEPLSTVATPTPVGQDQRVAAGNPETAPFPVAATD
jgi:hypothetical protein